MVRRWPVDSITPRAGGKSFLSRKNVRWNKFFNGLFGARFEHGVAFRAAGKSPGQRVKPARLNDLPQLLSVVVAFDKKKIRRLLLFKASVAGENQAVFLARRAN